jgi:hypothetical protein
MVGGAWTQNGAVDITVAANGSVGNPFCSPNCLAHAIHATTHIILLGIHSPQASASWTSSNTTNITISGTQSTGIYHGRCHPALAPVKTSVVGIQESCGGTILTAAPGTKPVICNCRWPVDLLVRLPTRTCLLIIVAHPTLMICWVSRHLFRSRRLAARRKHQHSHCN